MEHRKFTRVDFPGLASVRFSDTIVCGIIKNLGLQGMNIETQSFLPLCMPLKVLIRLASNRNIYLNARVVYFRGARCGMKTDEIDIASFVTLRNVISAICGDQMQLMRETFLIIPCLNIV